ncbi:MAG TPA: SRPBCC family protein [Vicinamibacterales bacterium]|nr:SRPBCC family protein [Vicinamibacterales bacterium]
MSASTTDRIEKSVVLRSPRARVWRALSDSAEFGAWFGARFEGPFVEGQTARGRITIPGYDHLTVEIAIVRMETGRRLSYQWHPYAVDPAVDYSGEPMTLVEFSLEDEGADTKLTVIESGFDQIPLARRAEAYRMNEGGWTAQVKNIAGHVAAK